ncbi:Zinc finger MYND-type [Penicillium lagena]|uniref:Zinc finger MYND-type n=1 Tax=Penicillium lagena TaxID=94218 RepID=UPI0025426039|nr:Zinc finger MYND-type [Penicillium lagena]KAJ5604821.1 Zinc finger MYND-type [Penicillium lagena]
MSSSPSIPTLSTKTASRSAGNGMGNGLFATGDINTGENVLHVKSPFVAVLDTPRLEDTCSACFGRRQLDGVTELKGCTGCRVVKYCDRTCQAKDWKFAHSIECSIFQTQKPKILPNNARAILRMVHRAQRHKYHSEEMDLFSNLETHLAQIQQDEEHIGRITMIAKAVKACAKADLDEDAIAQYAAKLDVNSFNLTTFTYDRVGLYMHPYAALINHSCDFNAVVGFDGDELFVKAIRPIKKDEQIFISYVDVTNPTSQRRKELSERYFFDCYCPKCTAEETEIRETSEQLRQEETDALEAAQKQAAELFQNPTTDSDASSETIEKLERFLHIFHETTIWPLHRQPYPSIRDSLILSLLSAGNFPRAFLHAAIRYTKIDPQLYSDAHPMRHLHAWVVAKLAIYLSQGYQPTPQDFKDPIPLHEFGFNFHYIIWYVLADLTSKQVESCTVPSFKKLVVSNFATVDEEFKRNGIDPRNAKGAVSAEWTKFEALVRRALEKE